MRVMLPFTMLTQWNVNPNNPSTYNKVVFKHLTDALTFLTNVIIECINDLCIYENRHRVTAIDTRHLEFSSPSISLDHIRICIPDDLEQASIFLMYNCVATCDDEAVLFKTYVIINPTLLLTPYVK